MPGMQNHTDFVLGEDYQIPVTIEVNGSNDITGGEVVLVFRAKSVGGIDFQKRSSVDSDWITIDTAATGDVTILISNTPSDIPAAGEDYEVGGWIQFAGATNVNHRFGRARWKFSVGPEGSISSPLP